MWSSTHGGANEPGNGRATPCRAEMAEGGGGFVASWNARICSGINKSLSMEEKTFHSLMNGSSTSCYSNHPFLASHLDVLFLNHNLHRSKSPSMVGKRNFTDNPDVIQPDSKELTVPYLIDSGGVTSSYVPSDSSSVLAVCLEGADVLALVVTAHLRLGGASITLIIMEHGARN